MRLNSALVVNIIKSILGSVFLEARCSAVGIRTGYIISIIRILIIEDYRTCATACWQSYSRRTQKLSMSVRLILYAAGAYPSLTIAGCRSREISGYVFFIWINIQFFYDSALSFQPFTQERHVIGRLRGIILENNPDRAAGDRGRRL